MKITPLFDRVLIKEEVPEQNHNGFMLSKATAENVVVAKVVSTGNGNEKDNGDKTEMLVKSGDRIVCSRYAVTNFKLENEEYGIIRQTDVLAKIN